jgi:hypothetical protein
MMYFHHYSVTSLILLDALYLFIFPQHRLRVVVHRQAFRADRDTGINTPPTFGSHALAYSTALPTERNGFAPDHRSVD